MHPRTFTRAAPISPPSARRWVIRTRYRTTVRLLANGRTRAAAARQPAVAHESHLRGQFAHIRRPSHAAPRAAGVSPPWLTNRTCEDNSAHIRTRPSHAAPRAAGVSPPWVCKPRLQLQCDEFRRFDFASAMHPTGALRLRRLHLECAEGDEFARRIHPTGGLRPPLLFRGAHVCRRKNDFCDTHTHIRSGAAGVSPPWWNRTCRTETHLQDGSLCVRRITPPRAAGVSPPWFGNRACEDNSAHIRTRPSHAAPRAAGVSPPWVCKPRLQLQCDEFRRFDFASAMHPTGAYAFGDFTWSPPRPMSSHAESIPRGAYAPRSCCSANVCRQKTIFAIHIRTSGQERRASARRGSRNALAGRFALRSANNATKSGERQPAVARESRLRGQFRTHPHTTVARSARSGARQPAVGL
jgi:hypothetical protein